MARVLLVEDSADVALIVRRLAGRDGHELAWCAEAGSAWDEVRRRRPDLVLLDFNLPGERGDAWCRRVRAAPSLADVPIALLASWGRPEDVAAGLEAGTDYVIPKDLLASPDGWSERLRELLAARGRAGLGSLEWPRIDLPPATRVARAEALNRVLRHPLARHLGPDVLRLVLRRAAAAAGAGGWLGPDGLSLDASRAGSGRPEAVAAFAAAVAEQLWCLLGTRDAKPLREALAAALSGPDP
jgi:CheY-like chemotaxis protein